MADGTVAQMLGTDSVQWLQSLMGFVCRKIEVIVDVIMDVTTDTI